MDPLQQGTPRPATNSGSEDLVLLDLPQAGRSGNAVATIDAFSTNRRFLTATIATALNVDLPQLDIPEDQSDEKTTAPITGDHDAQSDREHLVGIYSGQIRARIERIWRRPRTAVNEGSTDITNRQNADESFHCLVNIVQDSDGRVQETQLLNCNGSIAWQQSLVRAINQSSPLPAPPDPKVFTRTVTLRFLGLAFVPGVGSDEYEIQGNPVALANTPAR